ncbi:hypothetical protein J1605_020963 [Eschrichtius robustus]|uniref:Uncharacterized protein n=1 Tax=Eschrichtius robustus TaxID=9764 RepID=A0AB34HGW8_ESCRO|nr:hypothetical protein J1605_020963 [Eschrichtius robustus]
MTLMLCDQASEIPSSVLFSRLCGSLVCDVTSSPLLKAPSRQLALEQEHSRPEYEAKVREKMRRESGKSLVQKLGTGGTEDECLPLNRSSDTCEESWLVLFLILKAGRNVVFVGKKGLEGPGARWYHQNPVGAGALQEVQLFLEMPSEAVSAVPWALSVKAELCTLGPVWVSILTHSPRELTE